MHSSAFVGHVQLLSVASYYMYDLFTDKKDDGQTQSVLKKPHNNVRQADSSGSIFAVLLLSRVGLYFTTINVSVSPWDCPNQKSES